VAESVKDDLEKPESIKDDKSKEPSRRESLVEPSAVISKESSPRPTSVASDHEPAVAAEVESKLSISPKDASRPGSVGETASSPIEEAAMEFSEIEVVKRASLALNLQAGSGGKLPTDSSPVDVAEGDFSHVMASASSVSATLTKPAELSQVGAADTVSSPVDEAPKSPSALEQVSRPDSPAECASAESAKDDKSALASKEPSRAESVAESHKDDDVQLKSSVDEKSTEVKDLKSPVASKEASRPPSVAETASSPIDEAPKDLAELVLPLSSELKGDLPTLSSPVDVAHGDFPQTATPTSSPTSAQPAELSKVDIQKTASSPVDEAPKSLIGSPAEERPESPAESAKDEAEKPVSVIASKEASRRESVAESSKPDSVKDEKSATASQEVSKEASRQGSVVESIKDGAEKSKDSSRPPSVAESIVADSAKDDKSPLASREISRPGSVVESLKDDAEKSKESSRPDPFLTLFNFYFICVLIQQ